MKVTFNKDGGATVVLSAQDILNVRDAALDAEAYNHTSDLGSPKRLVRAQDLYMALLPPAAKANDFVDKVIKARVPCAYGSPECKDKTFAPNGVGKLQHTTCEFGRAALKAARS